MLGESGKADRVESSRPVELTELSTGAPTCSSKTASRSVEPMLLRERRIAPRTGDKTAAETADATTAAFGETIKFEVARTTGAPKCSAKAASESCAVIARRRRVDFTGAAMTGTASTS